jgi:hypothetical protein
VRIVPRSVAATGTVIFGSPSPSQPPAVRTPLEKLDIDETTRKRLRDGNVPDVEAILETEPPQLAKITGDAATASKLIEMARALLAGSSPRTPSTPSPSTPPPSTPPPSTPPPSKTPPPATPPPSKTLPPATPPPSTRPQSIPAATPTPTPGVRTPLDKLDLDDAMRKRLRAGNIVDVEGILEADEAKLSEIVGDRATASKLRETSKALLAGEAPSTGGTVRPKTRTTAKKTPKKTPKT